MTGLIDFSTNAAENGAAAPPVNWQEGMPAQAVNNSARETMAALARWHADNSGSLAATISGNVVSIASNQVFTPAHFARNFTLSFTLPAANAGPVLLNLDNNGPRPWRRTRGYEFAPGDLFRLVVQRVAWSPDLGSFVSLSPHFDPPGKIDNFGTVDAIPPGWVECDGRALSRASYATLFLAIGTTYGAGDGTTTFNVPNIAGRAVFGRDAGAGRLTGAGGIGGNVGDVGGTETVALSEGQMPSHSHGGSTGDAGSHNHGGTGQAGQHNHGGSTGNAGAHNHTGTTGGAGGHAHGGTTNVSGSHIHNQGYTKLSIYGGGGGLTAISEMYPPSTGNSVAVNDGAGEHQHAITTDAVGDHTHNFTTSSVADHAHAIGSDGNHTHAIGSDGNHTHSLTLSNAGGGQGHPNMPPGLVVVFAIKA